MKNTKLIVLMLAILSVIIVLTGCGSETVDTTGGMYNDGEYEGSSDAGMHPGLKVSVTVEGEKITEVKIVEHEETEGIGTTAIEELPSKIVEAQSTEVDSISGASITSVAIKEAVDMALTQAIK